MSTYAVQQAIFDHLRALEVASPDGDPRVVEEPAHALTVDEARALRDGDVAAFYRMGVHPVLINAWCRANGWKGPSYRVLFPKEETESARRGRWQRS